MSKKKTTKKKVNASLGAAKERLEKPKWKEKKILPVHADMSLRWATHWYYCEDNRISEERKMKKLLAETLPLEKDWTILNVRLFHPKMVKNISLTKIYLRANEKDVPSKERISMFLDWSKIEKEDIQYSTKPAYALPPKEEKKDEV